MIRCLVTDRRRLAGDTPCAETRRRLVALVRNAVAAGVDVIQVRERDLEAAELALLVDELVAVAAHSSSRIVINDRLDVALACRAHGVHLRSDSFAPADVRRIVPAGFLVGRSVHRPDDAAEAGDADYLIAGTVFPSESKPGAPLIGLDGLRAIVRATPLPVLAIGGVTAGRFADIAAAGAAGVAGIALFLPFDTPNPRS